MDHKKTLVIILLIGLFLRLLSAAIVPVFEKPDEEAHYDYIKYVLENKSLPIQQANQIGAEFFQPPFYQIIIAPFLGIFNIFTKNISFEIYFLRTVSIMISMITLYLIYKIAAHVFGKNELALGALAFAAFLPTNINMNSNVTNSNFADLISAIILYLLLILISKKNSLKLHVSLGILAGIALITRFSIIPAIMTIPLAYSLLSYPKLKNAIKPLLIIGIIALAIASWSFIRNVNLYGDILGFNAVHISSPKDEITVNAVFIGRLIGWTFITFWVAFGNTNGIFIGNLSSQIGIIIFAIAYLLLLMFSLASLYGLFLEIHKNFKKYLKNKALLILILHLSILLVLFLTFNLRDFQPQGRLFLPAMSTVCVLFTYGIYNVFKSRKYKKFLSSYIMILLTINVVSIASAIVNFYF